MKTVIELDPDREVCIIRIGGKKTRWKLLSAKLDMNREVVDVSSSLEEAPHAGCAHLSIEAILE